MAENSSISWTNHTFNPWVGCQKVGPPCAGCYAQQLLQHRLGRVVFGEIGGGAGTRERTSEANWKKPLAWNKQAAGAPGQTFVFCASLADVFDNAVPKEWRRDLFDLIRATPNLTWLLLTKRPGNIVKQFADTLPPAADKRDEALRQAFPRNIILMATVASQEEANREVAKLLKAKALLGAALAGLSMEPLLGPVDLTRLDTMAFRGAELLDALRGDLSDFLACKVGKISAIDWVIVGGETDQGSHKARPADPDWFRSLRDQCAAAGVPFHFKQWGEWHPGAGFVGSDLEYFDGRVVHRGGKKRDPGTLDGVLHDARPEVGNG